MRAEPFTFYEFFAGGGMARAGLGRGWRCLFANDFDPRKAAVYRDNWGDEDLRVGDVWGLTTADLPRSDAPDSRVRSGAAACAPPVAALRASSS